nr:uncharacterized protein LOC110078761 isoform X4 [Pogona vitticeps]
MSFGRDRPVPLPRTAAKVEFVATRASRKPLSNHPTGSHLSSDSVCQDNLLVREDEQNSELHASLINKNDQKKQQEEKMRMKYELEDLRAQYEQLLEEGSSECFDERRVNLLKAQVLQLERQVVLLTEGLSSRAALMLELNTSLQTIADKLSSFLSTEGTTSEVSVPCAEIRQTIERCQTMRLKLQRNQKVSDLSRLALPWTLGGNFVIQPVTLLDVCYGKIENLNLRYVSALEGKLSKLWRHLLAMRQNLSFMLAPGQMSSEAAHHTLPTVVYARLINHAAQCHRSVEECCRDLFTLTLLVPSAPWTFALQAELNFHRTLYNLQVKYTEALFSGIKQAYRTFQDNVAMVLCSPLQDVFSSYAKLKTEASESALRGFLAAFKNNAEQIQYAVESLTPPMNQQCEGDEALSKFGKEFFLSLERVLKACGEQRDKAASEMETLQTELDQALETLRNLREKKAKKSGINQHFSAHEEGTAEGMEASSLNVCSRKTSEPDSASKLLPHRSSHLLKHGSVLESVSVNPSSKQKGKLLQRSKSMKATEKPPWQA